MRAYETRCAVCSLAHGSLLDAAHIVSDGHDAGIASVRNGLALCKIHHAAFDVRILGITPTTSSKSARIYSPRSTDRCSNMASRSGMASV
ncbi:HNH endonuclease signature motif containing protein [Prescottella defluvii]|nr:HNH endonuclease signature motif containing protein [Prescottella defluvii]